MKNKTVNNSLYANWRAQDIVLSVMLISMTIIMLGASAVTMYSTLISSGEIAFLEQPILAIILSFLSPAAGMSIKALSMAFQNERSKAMYRKMLFILTALAIIVWIYFFSITFNGLGSELVIDDVLNSDGQSNVFTFAQLSAEILIGASLYTAWQALHDSYSPQRKTANPLIPIADKAIRDIEAELADVDNDISDQLIAITKLKAMKESFINRQLEALVMLKASYQNLNDLLGDSQ